MTGGLGLTYPFASTSGGFMTKITLLALVAAAIISTEGVPGDCGPGNGVGQFVGRLSTAGATAEMSFDVLWLTATNPKIL